MQTQIKEIIQLFSDTTQAMQDEGMEPTYETVAVLVAAMVQKQSMDECVKGLECLRRRLRRI